MKRRSSQPTYFFFIVASLAGCSFHPAARASRSVEISAIRPAIAPGEFFTHFRG